VVTLAALAMQVKRMATVPEFQPLPTKEPPPSPRQRPIFARSDSFGSTFSRDVKDDPAEARALPCQLSTAFYRATF
jgi:hypothetical protein